MVETYVEEQGEMDGAVRAILLDDTMEALALQEETEGSVIALLFDDEMSDLAQTCEDDWSL